MKLKGVGHVHFVCPTERIWPELVRGAFEELAPETLQVRCVDGLDCWITRTYYELRCAGYAVTIGPDLNRNGVNVAGIRVFGRKQRDVGSFVVIPRLDAHHPMLANFVISQNGLIPSVCNSGHVSHWGQPGIRPRDERRGTDLRRIAYKGAVTNLDPQFCSDACRDALAKLDVALVLDTVDEDTGTQSWGDYQHVDAVLAVRNLTKYDAFYKPASKLVNAWWADVPALLGPEPAFQELRRSALDFIEIISVEDVLAAVSLLKAEPQRFEAMVNNGRVRRGAYSTQQTVKAWVDLFEDQIAQSFVRWQGTSLSGKLLSYGKGLVAEPFSKRTHHRRALGGDRILQD